MVKKVVPRLRELALAARGGQDAGSRNLGPTFFTVPVELKKIKLIPHSLRFSFGSPISQHMYRVTHLLANLGWVDLDLGCYTLCPTAQPLLPNSHQPKQNRAEGGKAKIKINLTQVRQEMCHPVVYLQKHIDDGIVMCTLFARINSFPGADY